jgi:ABC-type transport system involved in multi-copper enzyme maturation permease subunit
MTRTFALFDMINFVTPAKKIFPALIVVAVATALTPWPVVGIGAGALIMSLLASNPFAADERGRLDTLYATLPISRRTVVVGRYLALMALYLAVAAGANVAAVIASAIQNTPLPLDVLGLVNLGSFVAFAVALSVQLPFFFSVGFTRARPMMYIPIAVLAGVAWLAGQTGMLDDVRLEPLSPSITAALGVGGVVLAIAALISSSVISSSRYARRAL